MGLDSEHYISNAVSIITILCGSQGAPRIIPSWARLRHPIAKFLAQAQIHLTRSV